jgi:hypothetical protein
MEARHRISNLFQSRDILKYFAAPERRDEFAAYYTSNYLVQDTSEALWRHRQKGFSPDPLQAYIEFWGVMQALVIQQDAISELHRLFIGDDLNTAALPSWKQLREKRVLCAGHPANAKRGTRRTFMGRRFGGYEAIKVEEWDAATQTSSHPTFNLGKLLEDYDIEAGAVLDEILAAMKQKWP